ncbi:salivary glue protein Sgs-5-like [Drosophila busckii]|uniref:salivary glue protein Sgs-5-like n=1 Tax=Drosophila busckii TaxID=30019 RepID=UPI00083F3C16|nr:salivary glue protein Sgs-5-like [Drosophila busckii]
MFRVLFVLVAVAMSMVEATSLCGCSCGREDRRVCWAIENCVCRPFHNHCILKYTSDENEKAGKGPLIAMPECQCKAWGRKYCPDPRVVGEISYPSDCPCPYAAGISKNVTYPSYCEMMRITAEQKLPVMRYWKYTDLNE